MIAKTKQVQTILNLLRDRVTNKIVEANDVADKLRQIVIDNDLTEFFSPQELGALNSFVTDLASLAENKIIEASQNRYVKSHRSKALTIIGVND